MAEKEYFDHYIDGTAAPELVPEYGQPGKLRRPEKKPVLPKRRPGSQGVTEEEMGLQISLPFVLFLAAMSVSMLLICLNYIQVQTSINTHLYNIDSLQTSITSIRSENKALEGEIDTYCSLDYIYTVATQELGMTYAAGDQVIVYDKTESGYVRQYDDIP